VLLYLPSSEGLEVLKASAEMLRVGASATGARFEAVPGPWALAMTTAKYGRNTAPATNTKVSQLTGMATARIMQITLITMAIVYLMKRERRSWYGDSSTEVTAWGWSNSFLFDRLPLKSEAYSSQVIYFLLVRQLSLLTAKAKSKNDTTKNCFSNRWQPRYR